MLYIHPDECVDCGACELVCPVEAIFCEDDVPGQRAQFTTVAEQLQAALNSRVVIEQAKGKLAERLSIGMDEAFGLLRVYARNSNQRLTDIARNFVDSATADFPPPPREQQRR